MSLISGEKNEIRKPLINSNNVDDRVNSNMLKNEDKNQTNTNGDKSTIDFKEKNLSNKNGPAEITASQR
ncbi:MAG: hypothetical protein VX335_02850 [Pseudomonadota bacterium]|nr:hypothetical protein [Pseudomonadota bacterium]